MDSYDLGRTGANPANPANTVRSALNTTQSADTNVIGSLNKPEAHELIPYAKMPLNSNEQLTTAYFDTKFMLLTKALQDMSASVLQANTDKSISDNLERQDAADDRDKTNTLLEKLSGSGKTESVTGKTVDSTEKDYSALIWALGGPLEKLTSWFTGSGLDSIFASLADLPAKLASHFQDIKSFFNSWKTQLDNVQQTFTNFDQAFKAWKDRWDSEKGVPEANAAATQLIQNGQYVTTDIHNLTEEQKRHINVALETLSGRSELLAGPDYTNKNQVDTYAEAITTALPAMQQLKMYNGGADTPLTIAQQTKTVKKWGKESKVTVFSLRAYDALHDETVTVEFNSQEECYNALKEQGWTFNGKKWVDPYGNTTGRFVCQQETAVTGGYLFWYQQPGEAAMRLGVRALQDMGAYNADHSVNFGDARSKLSFVEGQDAWREGDQNSQESASYQWRQMYTGHIDRRQMLADKQKRYDASYDALYASFDDEKISELQALGKDKDSYKKELRKEVNKLFKQGKKKKEVISEVYQNALTKLFPGGVTSEQEAALYNYILDLASLEDGANSPDELWKSISGFYDENRGYVSTEEAYGYKVVDAGNGQYKIALNGSEVESNKFVGTTLNRIISDYTAGMSNFSSYTELEPTIRQILRSQGVEITKTTLEPILKSMDSDRIKAKDAQERGYDSPYKLAPNGSVIYYNADTNPGDLAGNTNAM